MRVIILSFDALEYTLVEKYNCRAIKQQQYGKINLETYLRNRPKGYGSGHPLTGEIYPIFITGKVPKDFTLLASQYNKEVPTIFAQAEKPLDIDIVGYSSRSWANVLTGQKMFGGVFHGNVPLDVAEKAYYDYAESKVSMCELVRILGYDMVFIYFKYPDKLQHIYGRNPNETKLSIIYKKTENFVVRMVKQFKKYSDSLIIIFSDHGCINGTHTHYGFWSSSRDLGRGSEIDLLDWFSIIGEWYAKRPD